MSEREVNQASIEELNYLEIQEQLFGKVDAWVNSQYIFAPPTGDYSAVMVTSDNIIPNRCVIEDSSTFMEITYRQARQTVAKPGSLHFWRQPTTVRHPAETSVSHFSFKENGQVVQRVLTIYDPDPEKFSGHREVVYKEFTMQRGRPVTTALVAEKRYVPQDILMEFNRLLQPAPSEMAN